MMITKRSLLLFGLLLALLLGGSTAVLASAPGQEAPEPEVINQDLTLTSDYEIGAGTVVNGDVVVFDGELDLAGTVNGDVILFGGALELNGTINGELVLVGGTLTPGAAASVSGDCLVVGGHIDRGDGAFTCQTVLPGSIGQGLLSSLSAALPEILPELNLPAPGSPGGPAPSEGGAIGQGRAGEPAAVPVPPPAVSPPDAGPGFVARFFGVIGRALLAGFLAFATAVVFPRRLAEVSDAVAHRPVAAGTIGFLTAVAALSLLALTSIIWVPVLAVLTLLCGLGLLLALAGFLFMGGTVIAGWTAVGALAGEWLADRLQLTRPSYATLAALGTAALTLAVGFLGLIPFMPDVFLGIALLSAGLGGVVLTRYGRQPYPLIRFTADQIKIGQAIENMPEDF